jgi:hypothetical protein
MSEKLERAVSHIEALEECTRAYHATNPYEVARVAGEDGRHRTVLKISTPPPSKLALIAGDAVHNIRAALDHVAWDLAHAGGASITPSQERTVAFPIHRATKPQRPSRPSLDERRKLIRDKIPTANNQAVEAVLACEAFKGGVGHDLWLVHELDVIDKHRALLVVLASNESMKLNVGRWTEPLVIPLPGDNRLNISSMQLGIRPTDREVHDGDVLCEGDSPEAVSEFEFAESIVEGTLDLIEPVVSVLRRCEAAVSAVVSSLQAYAT